MPFYLSVPDIKHMEICPKSCYHVKMKIDIGTTKKRRPPESFRPLLWGLRWKDIDTEEDKEDIIVNAINEGTLHQWRWLIQTYGKDAIREVLERRLETEFHPESRNLAKIIFLVKQFRHARRSSYR